MALAEKRGEGMLKFYRQAIQRRLSKVGNATIVHTPTTTMSCILHIIAGCQVLSSEHCLLVPTVGSEWWKPSHENKSLVQQRRLQMFMPLRNTTTTVGIV
jgi:hypothetical protein